MHGHTSPHVKELYALYNELLIEAEMHLVREATEWIPMIQERDEALNRHISQAIVVLKDGNEKMMQLLQSMRTVTNHVETPLGRHVVLIALPMPVY